MHTLSALYSHYPLICCITKGKADEYLKLIATNWAIVDKWLDEL